MRKQLALLTLALCALAPAMGQTDRFQVSADGQEVLDTQTKLVWKRCPEGMKAEGAACKGKPVKLSLAMARKLAEGSKPWRVPAKGELSGIVVKTKKKPLVDPAAFPNTPSTVFLATRPEFNDNLNGTLVDFGNGKTYGSAGSKHFVRLVRDQ